MITTTNWFYENLKTNIPFAFARYNDGEMMGIAQTGTTVARGDQFVDNTLSNALKEALVYKQKNYYVGIPCSLCYPQFNQLAHKLVGEYSHLTSAVLLTNKNWKEFIERFPSSLGTRRIMWIGGDDQDVEKLKPLGIEITKKGLIPRRNSWRYYQHILETFPSVFEPGDVVCVSLGPTARILVRKWFELMPEITFIDVGSNFDPFTRNVWHNCHKGWDETGFNLTARCEVCN